MPRSHRSGHRTVVACGATVLTAGLSILSGCPAEDPGDENNCAACAPDSAEQQACIDALRGCEETEDTDTPEQHEACEEDANANCE